MERDPFTIDTKSGTVMAEHLDVFSPDAQIHAMVKAMRRIAAEEAQKGASVRSATDAFKAYHRAR